MLANALEVRVVVDPLVQHDDDIPGGLAVFLVRHPLQNDLQQTSPQ